MRKFIVIAAAVLLVAGCDKENMNTRQKAFTDAPQIRLASPQQGQVFDSHDTIRIDGIVVDRDMLTAQFEIRDNRTGRLYFKKIILLDYPDDGNLEVINNNNGRFHIMAPIHVPAGSDRQITLVIEAHDKMQHVTILRVPLVVRPLYDPGTFDNIRKADLIHTH
ncbi:MAG TPA: hypothetical protein VD905_07225 [Flavobacteriales bacterium]|nr:hypothetical protein [Flavobacteriales bacterium]